jgi:alpha-glucosidase
MVNHLNIPPEKSKDVAIDGYGDDSLITVRDGARTPMQWDDSPQAGFSFGKDVEPWLPVNDNYPYVNLEVQLADEDSIWNFYRALLRVRKNSLALSSGSWKTLIHFPYEHLAYVREKEEEKVLVIINFSEEKPFTIDEKIEYSNWKVLLSNCQETGKVRDLPELLEPFEISILQKLS